MASYVNTISIINEIFTYVQSLLTNAIITFDKIKPQKFVALRWYERRYRLWYENIPEHEILCLNTILQHLKHLNMGIISATLAIIFFAICEITN